MAVSKSTKSSLKVRIATPQSVVAEADGVEACFVPTPEGLIGILPDHAQLMSEVGTGILRFQARGSLHIFVVSGGLVEVQKNEVNVLADVGESGLSIDLNRARESLERARKRISLELVGSESLDLDRALLAERRALARIEAAQVHASAPHNSQNL